MDCIFCKIVKGEIPCYKVYEDEDFIAFMDINPINNGHVLVIPKKHSELVSGLDKNILSKIMPLAEKIGSAIRKSGIKCEGMNFEIFDGKTAGQEVPHVHLHLIPRFSEDGYEHKYPAGYCDPNTRERLEKIAEQIRIAF
ncbi:MAG: HIT family protein [Candidatus Staskawiczbacteria bacterium]|nr:HIT family protein [Candidatus Staskawiczbacteria bacterium]